METDIWFKANNHNSRCIGMHEMKQIEDNSGCGMQGVDRSGI